MDKKTADKKIFEYRDRIFGFALDKTRNIDQAQELASDIIFEVYRAFLKPGEIANLDGYVYRISKNVWARYVHTLETGRHFEDISNMEIAAPQNDGSDELEMQALLRREIGFLSQRQRTVIYMFYYGKKSVAEIAKRLEISAGTVKWHLSDARSKLKEGIEMNIDNDLDLNPIFFTDMGHSGYVGSNGDTADMFDSVIKMNIAWACYQKPLTLAEISRAIGVAQVYVGDQLVALVKNGYIDKVDNSTDPRYRTNMLLDDARSTEGDEERDRLLDEAAAVLAEKFFPRIFADLEASPDRWGMTCADDDLNYIKYALVMMALRELRISEGDITPFAVERPDGGRFVAYANVADSSFTPKQDPNWSCGDMTRDRVYRDPLTDHTCIQVDCRYCSREGRWRDNLETDWDALTKFMSQGLDSLTPEEFKRLSDKGYIFEDKVQPVVIRVPAEDLESSLYTYFKDKITVPEDIKALCLDIDRRFRDFNIKRHPSHMHGLINAFYTNILGAMLMLPRVIEKLLSSGALQPLTETQQKSVFSVLFLPEQR